MSVIRRFPTYKNYQRQKRQRRSVEIRDIKHRYLYHDSAPIVYPARLTAFVVHKPFLKRTEKYDTNKIAEIEKHLNDDDQLTAVSAEYLVRRICVDHIQNKNYEIQRSVCQTCQNSAFLIKLFCKSYDFGIRSLARSKLFGKFFRTSLGYEF